MKGQEVRRLLGSGKPPIELGVYSISSPIEDAEYAYYVCARVNTPSKEKPLLPKDYRRAARTSVVGFKYIEWTLRKLYGLLPTLFDECPEAEYVAVDMSLSGMKIPGVMSAFEKFVQLDRETRSRICLVFTSDILLTEASRSSEQLMRLKEQGFRIALGDYGSAECPVTVLEDLPVDVLFIDEVVAEGVVSPSSPYRGIVAFANAMGKRTVLPLDLPEEKLSDIAAECGCAGYMSYAVSRAVQ
ncbi:MAG: EAL domain-containing protein [Clostridia bacterium]|nr:EAL domain-containing protein [Clostridia bacterium]